MDWTGGVRKRFAAGKNNSSLLKQKQHFSMVRAALQNTPSSQRMFTPEFLRPPTARSPRSARERHHSHSSGRDGVANESGHSTQHRPARPRRADPVSRVRGRPALSIHSQGVAAGSTRASPRGSIQASKNYSGDLNAEPGQSQTAEECLLVARRRRLLGRSDWLGLSATRPLHLDLRSDRDRDRIGKRRKVDKTKHKSKPAGQRLLTPLFDERLAQPDHVMSGALPDKGIWIKVGTEALASQTLPSRRSHTPVNTSMKPPFTECDALSEESMLLGDDGDSFEAYEEPHLTQSPSRPSGLFGMQAPPGMPDMLALPEDYPSAEVAEPVYQRLEHSHMPLPLQEEFMQAAELTEAYRASPSSELEHQPASSHEYAYGTAAPFVGGPRRPMQPLAAFSDNSIMEAKPAYALSLNGLVDASDGEDHRLWANLMGIPHRTSSHASVAALKSSSQHITCSSSSYRPVLAELKDHCEHNVSISTPRGMGTQKAIVPAEASAAGEAQSRGLESPSASLREITRLARLPQQNQERHTDEDEADNALWREFIIGSNDSSQSPLQQVFGVVEQQTRSETDVEVLPTQSLATSGLGTSVNATQGETLFVTGSTSSVRVGDLHDSMPTPQNESGAGQATHPVSTERVVDDDYDSIEDIAAEPSNRRTTNIHAPTRIMSISQYRRPKRTYTTSMRRATHADRVVHRSKTRRPDRSIYDLIDTDGASLA